MVPARHQLLILAAIVVAGMVCLMGSPVAGADDGSGGCTLLLASSPLMAILIFMPLVAAAGLVAVLMSRLLGPLVGVFVAGMSLAFPAVAGGGIQRLMGSYDGFYWILMLESLLWAGLMLGVVWACFRWGQVKKSETSDDEGQGGPAFSPEPGSVMWVNLGMAAAFVVVCLVGPFLANKVLYPMVASQVNPSVLIELMCTLVYFAVLGYAIVWAAELVIKGPHKSMGPWKKFEPLAATVVGVVVGLAMASVWVRNDDPWQAAWSLLISFGVGALWARLCFPAISVGWLMAVPMWAAAISYAMTAMAYGSTGELLKAAYLVDGPFLWRSSMALPVLFASTGVAGVCMGLGWFNAAMLDHEAAARAEAEKTS